MILRPLLNGEVASKQQANREEGFRHYMIDHYPEVEIINLDLKESINIRQVSMIETVEHASKSYLSTLAVLQLDAILTNARKVKIVPKDNKSKNQEKFDRMILMEYVCPGIGLIKLTVGVMRRTHDKVQYCITAIEPDTRKAPLKDASLCPGKTQ